MSLFLAGMVRFGEIDVTSVSEMVDKVIAASIGADELITRLNILGHGSKDSMSVGDDEVMIINLTSFRPLLRRLQYRFDDRGSVFLQQCLVGSNMVLMQRLAEAFNVVTYAGTGDEHPNYLWDKNSGYAYADPDGNYGLIGGRP